MKLLPVLFKHWGLPASYSKLFSSVADSDQPLHAVDYLFAIALLKAYSKKSQPDNALQYNFLSATFTVTETIKLADRLVSLKILSWDELNLEPISD